MTGEARCLACDFEVPAPPLCDDCVIRWTADPDRIEGTA